ncbi:MAG TPA: hypothetical protein VJM34_00205 [Novosphingobium sp.]|nr:hypothetical protein [Novosphingobium sp.]
MALLLLVVALGMKALVPGGYMLGHEETRTITVQVCADTQGKQLTHTIALPLKAEHPLERGEKGDAKTACAFSALGFASLGGADLLLLAAAIVFIMVAGFVPVTAARPLATRYLQPPQRGPPLPA